LGRMGQRQDGADLVVADEPAHRPWLLPGPAIDLTRLDDAELLQEDVVVAVPPELLGAESRRAGEQGPTDPGASVGVHRADLLVLAIMPMPSDASSRDHPDPDRGVAPFGARDRSRMPRCRQPRVGTSARPRPARPSFIVPILEPA